MRHRRLLWILPALLLATVLLAQEAPYLKLTRVSEILTALLRTVITHYVEPIDADELFRAGVDSLLRRLDPYSYFIDEEGSDELDILSTGAYVGIGIAAAVRDSMLTVIEVHPNTQAWAAGIRVGDRIYKVDSAVVLHRSSRELRRNTRGEPGTPIVLWLLRQRLWGGYDTLRIQLQREEIRLRALPIVERLHDSIGYIRLERFSRRAPEELRQAIQQLLSQAPVRALVLDLRDNPGGLLDAAVNVCGLFLPPDIPIVTVRGRDPQQDRTYYAYTSPVSTELPLVVLINGRSASASEIVAGVLQDLDRAVLVGEPSLGKGVVQTMFPMPYGTSLRLTTARYFMPSGRTIQKQPLPEFAHPTAAPPQYYRTRNGRPVVANSGILPDTIVSGADSLPLPVRWLQTEGWLGRFATAYAASMPTLKSLPPSELLYQLERFLEVYGQRDRLYPLTHTLRTALQQAEDASVAATSVRQLERLLQQLQREEPSLLRRYQTELLPILERELLLRFLPRAEVLRRSLPRDPQLQAALELLENYGYHKILATSSK